jgi:serine/threonine-protein kinase
VSREQLGLSGRGTGPSPERPRPTLLPCVGASPTLDAANLISELKRRRVFRVLVGYGVVAFAVLQVAEPIMHALHLPEVTLTYTVVALALGFPVAVILAWAFDLNEGRIERAAPLATGPRKLRLGLLLLAIGLLAAAPGTAWYFLVRKPAPPAPTAPAVAQKPSIAVLPFVNLSSDKEQEYLSDGIAEEINIKLSRLKGLAVAARTSVARFKGATLKPSEIGAALGVAWLLEGSVRRAGDRIRVTTTLLKAEDGFRVWSEDAEAKLDDIFAVQERIASRTVDALALQLTPDERHSLSDWGTRNARAYDAYLQGQALYESFERREQFDAALGHFGRALAIDPRFAPALAGLGSVEAQYYRDFEADPARLARAEDAARRALEIDPRLGRAMLALGEVQMARFDYVGAAAVFARLAEEEPQNYLAWDFLGWAKGYQTPPLAAEAEQACRRCLQLNPAYTNGHYHLARALLLQGEYEEAAREIAVLEAQRPGSSLARAGRFWLDLLQGRPRQALAAIARDTPTPLNLSWIAMARAQLGERDAAFEALEKALAGGYRDAGELRASRLFAPLRGDPRFKGLLRKHGLEP